MSELSIANDFLIASFSPIGAELQSLFDVPKQEELLWQANPSIWPRHAPILFPIVGRLKDNTYTHNGVKFIMNQHGFARDSNFIVEHHSANEISFLLTENETTLEQFPFHFEFRVNYKLVDNMLIQQFSVHNTDSKTLYCSFGGHPAFIADPIESVALHFEPKQMQHSLYLLKEGSINIQPLQMDLDTIHLNANSFDNDALIFEKTANIAIVLENNGIAKIKISTCDMPYLGIWSKPNAPFVCIEPWQGWADFETHNGEIESKSGILAIEPGNTSKRKFEITVF